MAKNKKRGSEGIQAIKAKQRAKKQATKAWNRDYKTYKQVVDIAEREINKGYKEGWYYGGPLKSEMTIQEKIALAKSGQLNVMKVRAHQELGLHGNVGLGTRGKVGDTLLPSGIKRSQINKNRPATILLAERINKTFEDLPRMFAEKKVHTSQERATDLQNRLNLLKNKGLLVDTGRKISGKNVYQQRIDIEALKDYYMNADDKEKEKLDLMFQVINEGPEMSEVQYDYWRRDTIINAEKLGTTEEELRFTDMVLQTTGLFEAAKKEPDPSDKIKEARSMTAYIESKETYWDNEFKSELQTLINNEDFYGALEALKQQGYRVKYL